MRNFLLYVSALFSALWINLKVLGALVIPKRVKRALFTVAVQVKFANRKILHDATLEKLNAKLGLVHYSDTLDITKNIGKNLLTEEKVDAFIDANYEELCHNGTCPSPLVISEAASTIIESTPKWLRYGNERMKDDVRIILNPTKSDLNQPTK